MSRAIPARSNLGGHDLLIDFTCFPCQQIIHSQPKNAVCIGRKDNADEVQVVEEVRDVRVGKEEGKIQRAEALPYPPVDGRDWLDDLTDESLEDWEPLVRPLRKQLEDLAANATGYEDFMEKLNRLAADLDTRELQEALASAMFAAWQIAGNGERAGA